MQSRALHFLPAGQSLLQSRMTQSSALLIANTGLQAVSGYVYWQLVNRIMDPRALGVVSAALAACILLSNISSLGLGVSMIYARPRLGDRFMGVANAALLITAGCATLSATVFTIGIPLWSSGLEPYHNVAGWAAMVFAATGVAVGSLQDYLFLAKRRPAPVIARTFLTVSVRLVMLLLLVRPLGHAGATISFAIGSWVTILVSSYMLLKASPKGTRFRVDPSGLRGFVVYSRDTYLVMALSTATGSLLPVITLNTLGAEAAAHFYIATMLASMLFTVPASTGTALFMENSAENALLRPQSLHAVQLSLALSVLGGGAILILGPVVMGSFGTSYLREGIVPLAVLLASSLPMSFYSVGQSMFRATGNMRDVVIVGAAVTVATTLTAGLTAHAFGLAGVATAWFLGQTLGACLWVRARSLTQAPRSELAWQ